MIENLYVSGFKSYRLVDAVDSGGAVNEDVDIDTTNWPINLQFSGHIRQLTANEIVLNQKREVNATHRMYCKVLDITAEDRIIDPDSRTFDVKFVDNPHQLDMFLQVDLEIRT